MTNINVPTSVSVPLLDTQLLGSFSVKTVIWQSLGCKTCSTVSRYIFDYRLLVGKLTLYLRLQELYQAASGDPTRMSDYLTIEMYVSVLW